MKNLLICIFIISLIFTAGCDSKKTILTEYHDNNQDQINPTELTDSVKGTVLLEHSPFIIDKDIYLHKSDSLIIKPGVELIFKKDVRFVVKGKLIISGTKENRVKFRAEGASWGGLIFRKAYPPSKIEYLEVTGINIPDSSTTVKGAIEIYYSDVEINNTIIKDNTANYGGAIYTYNSSVKIFNSIIYANFARYAGGAIYSKVADLEVVNCSILENKSADYGSGIYFDKQFASKIRNTIIYKNKSVNHESGISGSNLTTANFKYNFLWELNGPDPLLKGNDNFHYNNGSPCIDAGDPATKYNDEDGTRNDIGAYGGPKGNW